jgi:hypothetical protein
MPRCSISQNTHKKQKSYFKDGNFGLLRRRGKVKIYRKSVAVKDLVEGYVDSGDEGVQGYGGRLDIRPPYQREFIYDSDRQQAVIDSVLNEFPLGIIYWVDHGRDEESYEVLDGQQRILSICKFYKHEFALIQEDGPKYFDGLTPEEIETFLNYELDVYVCSGTEKEKLAWFKRINIAGIPLSDQELRNASYTGPWLSSAKSYFSKSSAPVDEYNHFLSGKKNRQEWLETVLKWKSEAEFGKEDIEGYMAKYQKKENADELWLYFFRVMGWVNRVFIKYRSQMKGLPWGHFYNMYTDAPDRLDPYEIERRISDLMKHPDVQNKKGIYEYILDGDERHLNLRAFDEKTKIAKYEEQQGKCAICGKEFPYEEMHADHIVPFSKGGLTEPDNCQMVCAKDNWAKSNK